jgi:hypothetical protein
MIVIGRWWWTTRLELKAVAAAGGAREARAIRRTRAQLTPEIELWLSTAVDVHLYKPCGWRHRAGGGRAARFSGSLYAGLMGL